MSTIPNWTDYKFSFLPDGLVVLATPRSEEDGPKPENTIDVLSKEDMRVILSLNGLI